MDSRSIKIWSTKIFKALVLAYIVYSLPIIVIFQTSENLRFNYFEVIAHQTANFLPLQYVFIGDSLTKDGKNWGLRLVGNPLISKNLAVEGHNTEQIIKQVGEALSYSPTYIFVMAGTNDAVSSTISVQKTLEDYRLLLDKLSPCHCVIVVTLIPLQQNEKHNAKIKEINSGISLLAKTKKFLIIDLNPTIAPIGSLKPEFTTDGIHFSESAYVIWADKIKETLKNNIQVSK